MQDSAGKPVKEADRGNNWLASARSNMDKYVTRSPARIDFPLAEEIDPVRKTERVVLKAWTEERFTAIGFAIVMVLLLLMVVIVGPPPTGSS